MACDTRLKPRQTLQERAEEVRKAVANLTAKLSLGMARVRVDKTTGAIAFEGLTDEERDGVTDACAYRRIMASGSVTAKAAIARAEAMSGRSVSKQALAAGVHSHDGGKTWHGGH